MINPAIASDLYASALFFHLMVNVILECLLGIKGCKQGWPIQREKGILGVIEGYIGTVEAQGCGTLHLCIVLWLWGLCQLIGWRSVCQLKSFALKSKHLLWWTFEQTYWMFILMFMEPMSCPSPQNPKLCFPVQSIHGFHACYKWTTHIAQLELERSDCGSFRIGFDATGRLTFE